MSTRFSRPRRTKVYDCNYTIGENYYRPVVDDLDRKYSGRSNIASAANAAESSLSSLRATLAESDSRATRRSAQREVDSDSYLDEPRRSRPASSMLDDYDSIFDSRNQSIRSSTKSRALAVIEDEGEEFGASTKLKRIRAARAARAQALEDEMDSTTFSRSSRPALDYSEKVLDSVGLKNSDIGRARLALADDALFSKRSIKIVSSSSEVDGDTSSGTTKWSKLGTESDVDDTLAAAARARKSRARIADLEAEMGALTERTAAREKRAAGLRALVAENEANSSSSSKVSSSTSVRKVSSSVTSEKKSVTF